MSRSFLVVAACLISITIAFRPQNAPADGGGDLTLPVDPTVYQTSVNSFFDHHSPGPYDGSAYLPFTRWDTYVRNNNDALLANCLISEGRCYNGHEGIDFSTGGQSWIPITAAARGTVSGNVQYEGDWGWTVRLSHPDKTISTRYSHLISWTVSINQFVQRGHTVGYSGCSGDLCLGAHLDFGAYNSSGFFIDPFGWALPGFTGDPWPNDVGHLWGTRIGSFNSSAIAIKEGAMGQAWGDISPPGTGTITALSIDGSRIGVIQNACAYARDTSINTPNRPSSNNWILLDTGCAAVDIKLADNRVAVLKGNASIIMKEGPLNSVWLNGGSAIATGVQYWALTPSRLATITLNGPLLIKDGPWTAQWVQVTGSNAAKAVALTENWIGVIGKSPNLNQFRATGTVTLCTHSSCLNGWSLIDSSVTSISMGGSGLDKRMGWVTGTQGRAQEEILTPGWWVNTCSGAAEVIVNSGRVATRKTNGDVYVYEGEGIGCGSLTVNPSNGVRLN